MKNTKLHWLWIAIVVIILDQWTKQLALQYLSVGYSKVLLPFFNLSLAYNTGAAFSFLSQAAGWQRWFLILFSGVVSVGILIGLSRLKSYHRLLPIGLCLVLGGALSNLWDRIYYGVVIDFIDWHVGLHHWPTFNVADSAITLGICLLILELFFRKRSVQNL